MSRIKFEVGEIYHVFNRGTEKRDIFLDDDEYRYFLHLLFILNDDAPACNTRRVYKRKIKSERGPTSLNFYQSRATRNLLVDILVFTLMPNHFHLLLKPRVEGGVSTFMQKLGTAYTMMFNQKYNRTGVLFQGKYKAVHIQTDRQMLYIPHYIHLNPLQIAIDNNEGRKCSDKLTALQKYRWSSLLDYMNISNYPSITNREQILSLFGGSDNYIKDMSKFIDGSGVSPVEEFILIDKND